MNPTLSEALIERAKVEDPEGSQAEWEGRFRSDIESYVSRDALEACVVPNRYELPYISENSYSGFVDPSGGSRDSMTLAISHIEDELRVLDCIREVRPPFSPEQTTKDFADTLKEYHLTSVVGDRYGGEWPRERFQVHGINYELADKPKSDYYKELLPLINSGRVEFLDHQKMLNQILNLERRTARSGKDSIDHPPNSFDDLANAAAGVLVSLRNYGSGEVIGFGETLSGKYEGII
jgi:hypothetical protein